MRCLISSLIIALKRMISVYESKRINENRPFAGDSGAKAPIYASHE
jgi:hypothetical protein